MTLDIQYEPSDLRLAILLRPAFWARNVASWILGSMLVMLVLWPQQPQHLTPKEKLSAMLPGLLACLAVLSAMIVYRFFSAVAQHWKNSPAFRRAQEIQIDETCIRVTDIHSTIIHDWSSIHGWHETGQLFVLDTSMSDMLILPKRCFAAAGQMDEFRDLARRLINKPAPGGGEGPALPAPAARADAMTLRYAFSMTDLLQGYRRTFRGKILVGLMTVLFGITFGGLLYGLWLLPGPRPRGAPPRSPIAIVSRHHSPPISLFMVPSLWVLIGLIMTGFHITGGAFRRHAKYRRHVWLQRTAQIDHQAIAISTAKKSSVYPWHDVVKFVETRKLFMVYISRTQFEILPKRAFADAQSIDDFRGLAHSAVNPGARGPAFAVLPVAARAVATRVNPGGGKD